MMGTKAVQIRACCYAWAAKFKLEDESFADFFHKIHDAGIKEGVPEPETATGAPIRED